MKQKVLKYDVIFEKQNVGGYTVTVLSLPSCISEGDTFKEAKRNIAEAITLYLESLAMDGEKIPEGDTNIFIDQVTVNRPNISSQV